MSVVATAYHDALDRSAPADAPRVRRFTYDEYIRMCESGLFGDRRVELIEGRIIDMAAVGPRHFVVTVKVDQALRRVCPPDHFVTSAGVLRLGGSGPLPDVSIIPGSPDDYLGGVPTTAALIVEVADSTLAADRLDKASLYAKARIADYWIVNLVDDVVEVYRDPRPDATQPSGFTYAPPQVFRRGQTVTPLAISNAAVKVDELLP